MPGYTKKTRPRYQHDDPKKPQHSPYREQTKIYGAAAHDSMPTDDYWLCTPPRGTLIVLVEVEVWLVTLSWGTRCVPRGSHGLILGSTGRGSPLLYPTSVFPTHPLRSLGFGARGNTNGELFVCRYMGLTF